VVVFCCPCIHSGAINFPYGQGFRDELLLEESSNVKNILSKATPGALEQAFSEVKPTTLIGTCIIVYDNVGDNMDLTGPAAVFAETAVRLRLVPEVGRIAGGFQAFQELQNCVFVEKCPADTSRTSMASSDRPLSLRSRLSLANTPQTCEAHNDADEKRLESFLKKTGILHTYSQNTRQYVCCR
jgi:hypothetical protein